MSVIEITTKTTVLYDTETKLSKVVSCETVEKDFGDNAEYKPVVITKKQEKPKILKESEEIKESSEPYIELTDKQLIFNQAAIDYMFINPGETRLAIKYDKTVKGEIYPIIAKIEIFGIKTGLKMTQKRTVAFRGGKNLTLKEHGNKFKLQALENGAFKMIGNIVKDIPLEIIIPKFEKEKSIQIETYENACNYDELDLIPADKREDLMFDDTDFFDLEETKPSQESDKVLLTMNNNFTQETKVNGQPSSVLEDEELLTNDMDFFI